MRSPLREGRTSFFVKKEAKKLLLLGALVRAVPQPAVSKSFLLLFFKKEALACLLIKTQTLGPA
jgi:hypothetical protein